MICAECTEEIADTPVCPKCGGDPLLVGRYALHEEVGHGAMGMTFRADRLVDGREVAVKELPLRRVDSVKSMELFEREAAVLESLEHPGVPEYIEDFTSGAGRSSALFIVQEFVDGHTLADEVERRRPTEEEVLEILAELLEIVGYLQNVEPPVVHRDLKPDNIMRRASDGSLVLIDFGSVRAALETEEEGGSTVAGTFGYMAPEQFMGRATPATDIYGLGATAIALLSRRDPHELLGTDQRLHWEDAVDVSPAFAALLGEMLAPNPDERPSDAAALAERVRRIARGEEEVPARPAEDTALTVREPAGTALATLPPAPRELTKPLLRQYGDDSNFRLMFGATFGGIGGLVGGIVPIVIAVSTGQAFPLLFAVIFLVVFGGIGGWFFLSGWRSRQMKRHLLRNGVATEANATYVGDANYTLNGRTPTVVDYDFVVNGQRYHGTIHNVRYHSFDDIWSEPLPLLFDPDDPNVNSVMVPGSSTPSGIFESYDGR